MPASRKDRQVEAFEAWTMTNRTIDDIARSIGVSVITAEKYIQQEDAERNPGVRVDIFSRPFPNRRQQVTLARAPVGVEMGIRNG